MLIYRDFVKHLVSKFFYFIYPIPHSSLPDRTNRMMTLPPGFITIRSVYDLMPSIHQLLQFGEPTIHSRKRNPNTYKQCAHLSNIVVIRSLQITIYRRFYNVVNRFAAMWNEIAQTELPRWGDCHKWDF